MSSRFSEKWLETVCNLLPGAHSAIFVVPDQATNQMHLLARWPLGFDKSQDLFATVKYALKKGSEVCFARAQAVEDQQLDYFAKPVYIRSELAGVLAIRVNHQPVAKHQDVFDMLNSSIKWLGLASFSKPEPRPGEERFYSDIVGVLASCFEQDGYQQGLMRMVAELTSQFNCERVAFAEQLEHHCRVIAISNSAQFDQRSNLVRKIENAMDEAIEQDSVLRFPNEDSKAIQRAHQDLSRQSGSGSIATIPLISNRKVFGAITLLCGEELPLDDKSLDLCRQTLSLLTPFLVLKRDQEKAISSKIVDSMTTRLNALFGVKHLRAKMVATMLTVFLVVASVVEADFRVTANAILEGEIQRVIAAPISGYLLSSTVRAGDTIRKGEIMASLNDTELKLEMTRLKGSLRKSRREYREAQSTRDLVKVRVIKEQINQIDAEIDLVNQQLASINLSAPFDGVVIEGDLSQTLGSPVERGETLFKIAPLEGYRIILKVDESEIAYVEKGQAGSLTLSSLSEWELPLKVEHITSVAKAEDGANIFRVEASLPDAPGVLRPGMEGIGKINAGRERLIWIWTHQAIDWFRLWVWSWWP